MSLFKSEFVLVGGRTFGMRDKKLIWGCLYGILFWILSYLISYINSELLIGCIVRSVFRLLYYLWSRFLIYEDIIIV